MSRRNRSTSAFVTPSLFPQRSEVWKKHHKRIVAMKKAYRKERRAKIFAHLHLLRRDRGSSR